MFGERLRVRTSSQATGQTSYVTQQTSRNCLHSFPTRLPLWDYPEDKEIIITSGASAILRGTNRSMASCDHEEADTRLLVHLQDALLNDCTNCLVRTVDTDVVVLIGKFHHLITLCQEVSIWVAFGTGKNFTYHHINAIYENLGREKSLALPVFHSFTGCDTTSTFFGRGKKSAWEAWNCNYDDVTRAFSYMALHPFTEVEVDTQHFQLLERYTIIKPVTCNMWTKLGKSSLARRRRQWRGFPQPRMHCYSTRRELYIRREYGAPVS